MFWLNLFNIIGIIAFSISGALAGIRKKLDLFGVITLSIVTANFGGLMRDIFLSKLPPSIFTDPELVFLSILVSLITFITYPLLTKRFKNSKYTVTNSLYITLDAIGLGAFTTLGTKLAIDFGMNNMFSVVCLGLISGVGGGIIRDVFIGDIPIILKKEIYASAAVLGSSVMFLIYSFIPTLTSLYLCFIITMCFRVIASLYNFNLPTVNIE